MDLLGFSIGSFVGHDMTLTRSALVHRLIPASAAPQGAPGMHLWAPDIRPIGKSLTEPEGYPYAFFTDSAASGAAGQQVLGRIYQRTGGRDRDVWQTCPTPHQR